MTTTLPTWDYAVRAPRVRGAISLPLDCDTSRLLPHVLADLHERGCTVHLGAEGELVIAGRSERRGSVLGFITDGVIRCGPDQYLRYAFSLRGGLLLCLFASPVGALGGLSLGSLGLAIFGALAPILWLYGANHLLTALRVPAYLTRLCQTALRTTPGAGPPSTVSPPSTPG